ncbi:putative bifunctional diguanylate cyclase/phosphodiesterase [Aromatoleum buckelii]|uniref:EAL domain-containing protein n=1 Tax=Aromatoleum buckelii TaxID=200254 RepID=A0ABX1N817_9RHOO|nr:EAL domain-containing protein [Aromatoleum buckelii]MCK0513246.1 EAL domain-containing protein [Aromatoleum buckelii]
MHTTHNPPESPHRWNRRRSARPRRRVHQATDATTRSHLHIGRDLRRALEHQEFVLHYQPEIDTGTGRMVAAEALIRWLHPQRGMIGPNTFIPVAEHVGLIGRIGQWVLETACAQLHAWRAAGHDLRVAVNFSVEQLRRRDITDTVAYTLERFDLRPDDLVVEITESICMHAHDRARESLAHLAQLGVRLAIDDFGTGYSSLSYLKRMPVRILKIDRSFVVDLADAADATIVRNIISLAHELDLTVIVEGVETADQHELLRVMGCDVVQGYLVGKSLPPALFHDAFLAHRRHAIVVQKRV